MKAAKEASGKQLKVDLFVRFEHGVLRFYEDDYSDHMDTKLTVFTNDSKQVPPLSECNSYEKALRYALNMIQSNEVPKNDISEAVRSIQTPLQIRDMIL